MDVRMVYFNRQHPKDPDPTFNGDTTAHWDGDTLVLDVIAIDQRMRNFEEGPTAGGIRATRSASPSALRARPRTT
jgi:hypothetical protein